MSRLQYFTIKIYNSNQLLQAPRRVCMPPPFHIDNIFYHCDANMGQFFQMNKFFYKIVL